MPLLAADVGGTKTLLGLFDRGDRRPRPIVIHEFATDDHPGFAKILDAFAGLIGSSIDVEAAAVGVAGPVVAGRARLTNVSWDISAAEIADYLGGTRAHLLNDLEAMATGAGLLTPDEIVLLQEGLAQPAGNAAVIAAGTGLGEALLHRVNGRLLPVASEGGHADFAPRTDREIELLRMLRSEFGRVEVEHILSGPGLVNLARFTHGHRECEITSDLPAEGKPAAISQAALARRCQACVEALAMFADAYGAEAGNLALRGVATSGIYVGGGIAPKILPALQDGRFMAAFRDKGTMSELMAQIPVGVILTAEAALLGAAMHAQEMTP